MDLLIGKRSWHVAGYRLGDLTPAPVCGAKGVSLEPWKGLTLPEAMCGNCARICHLNDQDDPSYSGDTTAQG